MTLLTSLLIVGLAGLVHASFQLSISMLTLLGGHAIGAKKSSKAVLRLTSSYVAGSAVMTVLVVSFLAVVLLDGWAGKTPLYIWAIACGVVVGIGLAVWLFYYRREPGTQLWVPRSLARYLTERTKATHNSAEAFSLGLVGILGELLFIIAPALVSALVLVQLPGGWQLVGIALYAILSLSSLIGVWVLIGSGHTLAGVQRWRETNKRFLQFAAGGGLLVLGAYVFVNQVLGVAFGGGA